MILEARGQPLHTRGFTIRVEEAGDGALRLQGEVIDLRKRGFVPVAGILQPAGSVHHVEIELETDPARERLRQARSPMRRVALEPSALSGGETCRQVEAAIEPLAGAELGEEARRRLDALCGGERGCSHVLALARLALATLDRVRECEPTPPARRPGEGVWMRSLCCDGFDRGGGILRLLAELQDLHGAPAPERAAPMERLGGQWGVRAQAEVERQGARLAELSLARRRCRRVDLERSDWETLDPVAASLRGVSMTGGLARACLRRLRADGDEGPVRDLLLQLAPSLIQCFGALSEDWPRRARDSGSRVGIGAPPGSCYLWRRGGALDRLRESEGEAGAGPEPIRDRP